MAYKPWLQRHYTLIVVPHAEAKFRKVKLSYWAMMLSAAISAVLLTLLITFAVHYYLMLDDVSTLEHLTVENQRLSKENAEYENLTTTMMNRLDTVESQTRILSTMAGVKPVTTEALGDINNVNSFDNVILDREIPIANVRLDDANVSLDQVEVIFRTSQEKLDYTPSIWPLSPQVGYISSIMRYRSDPFTKKRTWHAGIDISCERGTPIFAPANGVVVIADSNSSMGNRIIIDHNYGMETVYGHLSGFNVKKNDRVARGDLIGFVGNTGRSTGPHLHYEIKREGGNIDPRTLIYDGPTTWDVSSERR